MIYWNLLNFSWKCEAISSFEVVSEVVLTLGRIVFLYLLRMYLTFSSVIFSLNSVDVSRSYALLITIEFSFHFGFLWYSSFVINFPRFFKRYFRPIKIFLLRYSQNSYQIWLYKLNLCEELPYQIVNIWAVIRVVFCYHKKFEKIIIEKKHCCRR